MFFRFSIVFPYYTDWDSIVNLQYFQFKIWGLKPPSPSDATPMIVAIHFEWSMHVKR